METKYSTCLSVLPNKCKVDVEMDKTVPTF